MAYRMNKCGDTFYKCDFCAMQDLDACEMVQSGQFPWEIVHELEDVTIYKYTHCCKECLESNIEAQIAVDGYIWEDE